MRIAGLHSAFLDFTVWDNDGLYALVTVVSIVFAIALIVVVMRKSREHDAANHVKAPGALTNGRAARTSAVATDQPVTTGESQHQAAPSPTSQHGH